MFFFTSLALLYTIYVGASDFNCSSPSVIGDRRRDLSQWTLAQFNVEWLFTEPYKDCPGNGCSWSTPEDEYIHLETIAKRLTSINADTVHLCEVQSCTQLEQLIELLPDSDYRAYLIQGTDSYTGQNVGLLTRVDPIKQLERTEERVSYPVQDSKCGYVGDSGTEGVSKHLISDFTVNNISFTLIGVHLLSKPNDPTACTKREAQAQVLQNLIYNRTIQKKNIIVLGDLNDYDGDVPDLNSDIPNSRVLRIMHGYEGIYGGEYELFSVGNNTVQSELYTEWWDETGDCVVDETEYSAIDHILMSQTLYERVVDVQYYHEYDEGCETYDSDHYPIVVRLEM